MLVRVFSIIIASVRNCELRGRVRSTTLRGYFLGTTYNIGTTEGLRDLSRRALRRLHSLPQLPLRNRWYPSRFSNWPCWEVRTRIINHHIIYLFNSFFIFVVNLSRVWSFVANFLLWAIAKIVLFYFYITAYVWGTFELLNLEIATIKMQLLNGLGLVFSLPMNTGTK